MKAVLLVLGITVVATVVHAADVTRPPVAESRVSEPREAPVEVAAPRSESPAPQASPATASRVARPCARYERRVDARKVRAVDAEAGRRGVGVYWVNPPMQERCVARR